MEGCVLKKLAIVIALSDCALKRKGNVARLLLSNQQSNGDGTAPAIF